MPRAEVPLDRYIAQENIVRFIQLLEGGMDQTAQKMVIRLLNIEKAKLEKIHAVEAGYAA